MRSVKQKYHLPQPPASEVRDYRRELWIGVAIAVARSENAIDRTAPASWADVALKRFDDQFGDDS